MKVPMHVVEMFLRSSGAPKPVIDLFNAFRDADFGKLRIRPSSPDDPTWELIGSDPEKSHVGFWARTETSTSRITIGIFTEGMDNETTKQLHSLAGISAGPTLPGSTHIREEVRQDNAHA